MEVIGNKNLKQQTKKEGIVILTLATLASKRNFND